MTKIILTVLAIAVCAEATFDVGLLLNLLKPPEPKYHPKPYHQPQPQPAPRVLLQPVQYYYLQRVTPKVASYYRHPVSPPVDIPQYPPISHSSATSFSDSVTVEAQPQPLSFSQVEVMQPPQQSLSLPLAESSPRFNVETVKSEGHSFALQPEPLNLDQDQTSDTVEDQEEQ